MTALDTSDIVVEGAIRLVSDDGDWFAIERAEHPGTAGLVQTADGHYRFTHSGRISSADVEGTAAEMRSIAAAIRERCHFRAKRCAVDASGERVFLWSPRNSLRAASVALEAAVALAAQIDDELGAPE